MNEQPNSIEPDQMPWWFRPWWIIGGMVALLIIAAPFAYRGYRISGLPDIGHPFDIEEFGTVDIPDAENAFVEYRLAVNSFIEISDADSEDWIDALETETPWADVKPNVRKWLEDNRPTLEIWRQGTEKSNAVYHQPKDVNIMILLPVTHEFRNFARISKLEGKRLLAEGDAESAWNVHRAAFRSSRHSGMHGTIIERLVGIAIHGMVTEDIATWSSHKKVDSKILELAMKDLKKDYQLTTPTSTMYKTGYFSYLNLQASSDELFEMADIPVPLGELGLFIFNEPEYSNRIFRQVFAGWLSQVDKPRFERANRYAGRPEIFDVGPAETGFPGQLPPEELDVFFERSLIAKFMLAAVLQVETAVAREQVKQACLMTLLASQWYKRDHGTFPEKLSDLVPKYLPEQRQDPYGKKGETIRYSIDDEKAVFWSVGKNETDDGGNIASPDLLDYGLEVKLKTED